MIRHRSSRLVGILLVAMVLALVICALTRSNLPLFIWLLVFCVTSLVGIAHEWFIVNKPLPPPRTGREVVRLLVGSYPYLAGLVFMAALTYVALKLLAGKNIGPYESRVIGKIAFFAVGSVFLGTYFLFALIFVVRMIRRR
jgi:hypothetical protein